MSESGASTENTDVLLSPLLSAHLQRRDEDSSSTADMDGKKWFSVKNAPKLMAIFVVLGLIIIVAVDTFTTKHVLHWMVGVRSFVSLVAILFFFSFSFI